MLDLGQRTLLVYLNGVRLGVMVAPGMKNYEGQPELRRRGSVVAPLEGPLRWAVDVGYGAVVHIERKAPPTPRSVAEAEAAKKALAAKEARERWWMKCKELTKVVAPLGAACGLLVLLMLISYFNGCGACENDAACNGLLFGDCVCTGNYLGEYCEESCGEFGQVVGSACVCSGNYTGTFCELDVGVGVDLDLDADADVGVWAKIFVIGMSTFLTLWCGVYGRSLETWKKAPHILICFSIVVVVPTTLAVMSWDTWGKWLAAVMALAACGYGCLIAIMVLIVTGNGNYR